MVHKDCVFVNKKLMPAHITIDCGGIEYSVIFYNNGDIYFGTSKDPWYGDLHSGHIRSILESATNEDELVTEILEFVERLVMFLETGTIAIGGKNR